MLKFGWSFAETSCQGIAGRGDTRTFPDSICVEKIIGSVVAIFGVAQEDSMKQNNKTTALRICPPHEAVAYV